MSIPGTGKWTLAVRSAVGLTLMLRVSTGLMGAQSDDPPARVRDVKHSAMAQELNWLAERHYDLSLARLDSGLLIAQRDRAAGRRSYLFVADVGKFLAGKRLERGYRLLPQTLTPANESWDAVFEKRAEDEQLREYAFIAGSSPDDLEKKARKTVPEGFVPVAIYTDGPSAAVFERTLDAGPWKILATRSTATMEKELAAAAGYRVMAAGGGKQLVYALARSLEAPAVTYRLLATTNAKSLERELNQLAGQGFRMVPSSLAALGGSTSLLNPRLSNEAVVLVENVPSPTPVNYRVVGALRVSTMEREILDAVSQGYAIVTARLGYEETVVILARQ